MKLKFIGEDGSMGLRTGEVYDTRIFIKGECLWVEWKDHPLHRKILPLYFYAVICTKLGAATIQF